MASQKKVLFGYLMVASALLIGATADTHTVGNSLGWTVPPAGSVAYKTWAGTTDFAVGDTVVFQWSNTHTVAQVNQSDYDACSATNAIGEIHTSSPYNFTLASTDPYYFICSIDNHCKLGMKDKIQAGAASSLNASAFFTILVALAIYFSSLV